MLSRVSRLSRFASPSLFRSSRCLSSFNPTGSSSSSTSTSGGLNESRRQEDLNRRMDQRPVYDVNEDMQDPITHSNSGSRQNAKAQTVAADSDEKTTPELEAALHSSYME